MKVTYEHKQGSIYAELEPRTPILRPLVKRVLEAHTRILEGQSRSRPEPVSSHSRESNPEAAPETSSPSSSVFMHHVFTSFVTHLQPGSCEICSLSASSSCL